MPIMILYNFYFGCLCLGWWYVQVQVVEGQNVVMTSSGTAIIAASSGLIVSSIDDDGQQLQSSPIDTNIAAVDVSIDPTNESLIFTLSTSPLSLCSYRLIDLPPSLTEGGPFEDLRLNRIGCAGEPSFAVFPFSGVSAYGGTLIISGGTGGFTVYQYDTSTGVIVDTPVLRNQLFSNIIGHPDVVMVNANLAALSTDFNGGGFRFGTQMVNIDVNEKSASFGSDYRVTNSLGFALFIGPANFPLVNAIYVYRTPGEDKTIMYTANGPMQIQDLSFDGVTVLINSNTKQFSAVTVAVNRAKQIVVFGGVLSSGGSEILVYDLSVDAMSPTFKESFQSNERITSVASGGDSVVFVTDESPNNIQFMDLASTTANTCQVCTSLASIWRDLKNKKCKNLCNKSSKVCAVENDTNKSKKCCKKLCKIIRKKNNNKFKNDPFKGCKNKKVGLCSGKKPTDKPKGIDGCYRGGVCREAEAERDDCCDCTIVTEEGCLGEDDGNIFTDGCSAAICR